jgi:hypothetical protein
MPKLGALLATGSDRVYKLDFRFPAGLKLVRGSKKKDNSLDC